MPSPKPYDDTINCGPNNPMTLINRGPIKVEVCYEDVADVGSPMYVEIRIGKRRQRTAISSPLQHGQVIGEILQMLGFDPEVKAGPYKWDEKYD